MAEPSATNDASGIVAVLEEAEASSRAQRPDIARAL
jgi:hypothetical protein